MNLKIAFGTVVYPEALLYLKDFFTSLRQQTYDGFDILCVNDGIHRKHLSEIQKTLNPKLIVIDAVQEKEFSIAANRILLLKEAKRRNYDLLVIGDSDDTFSRNRVAQTLHQFDGKMAFYYNQLYTESGEKVFPTLPAITDKIEQILEGNYLGMSNTAIHIKQLDFDFIQSLSEGKTNIFDWYLYSRILNEAGKGKLIDHCFTSYRIHNQNIAGIITPNRENLRQEINVKRKHYELLKDKNPVFLEMLHKYRSYGKRDVLQLKQKPPFFWWGMIQLKNTKKEGRMMFSYEAMCKAMCSLQKPYIIAEIGSNHNGDMDLARKMIDEAKRCGADCVKFQSWSKDTIFSKKVYQDNYFLADDYRNRTDYTLEEIVDKYHIGYEEHRLLKEYCDQVGIEFNSTPFSKSEADLLTDEFHVPFIKIASMDLNNIPFLTYIAKKGKPVVLSTGLGDLTDINEAVKCLKSNGCSQIILLHCVSIYPPDDNQVNLNNIDMLKDLFSCPVGYSDHTIGTTAPVMAIAKQVCIIEKHFTLDKEMEGWDHKVSASPEELSAISMAAKCGYKMLGSYQKVVNENEERRNAFKRSIVAAHDIKKGMVIGEQDLDFKRPGTGIEPKYYKFIVGRKAQNDIAADDLIKMEDF